MNQSELSKAFEVVCQNWGDEVLWKEFYLLAYSRLMPTAMAIMQVPVLAKLIVHDAIVKIWELGQDKSIKNIDGFGRAIVVNMALNHRRQARRLVGLDESEVQLDVPTQREQAIRRLAELDNLISKEELDLLDAVAEGYSLRELAEAFSAEEGTMGVRVSRLKQRLRDLVDI